MYYRDVEVVVRKGKGEAQFEEKEKGRGGKMYAGRLTLMGRDDLLLSDWAGVDGVVSLEEGAAVVGVASEEAAVPSEAAVDVISAPDPAAVAGAGVSVVVAAASPQ